MFVLVKLPSSALYFRFAFVNSTVVAPMIIQVAPFTVVLVGQNCDHWPTSCTYRQRRSRIGTSLLILSILSITAVPLRLHATANLRSYLCCQAQYLQGVVISTSTRLCASTLRANNHPSHAGGYVQKHIPSNLPLETERPGTSNPAN